MSGEEEQSSSVSSMPGRGADSDVSTRKELLVVSVEELGPGTRGPVGHSVVTQTPAAENRGGSGDGAEVDERAEDVRRATDVNGKVETPGTDEGLMAEADIPAGDMEPAVNPLGPLWQYRPVPPEAVMPDPHPEFGSTLVNGAHGMCMLGARARGKKHKHEGTNCDDWFEIASCGEWNVIAVADGAGSKLFSRVGARTACNVAVTDLRAKLADMRLEPRAWGDRDEVFARNEQGVFFDADLRTLGSFVQRAVTKAYQAVEEAAAVRRGSDAHRDALGGREIEANDLAATLLLVVQTVVSDVAGKVYDLALSISIGDGVIGTVSADGRVHLMMEADHGQFSGETEFLSARAVATESLNRRFRTYLGSPGLAFLMMTDGVSDDYFPNDPGLTRLFGDLALNGLAPLPPPDEEPTPPAEHVESLSPELPTVAGERLLPDRREPVALYSVARYAEQLGLPLDELVADVDKLRAGCRRDPLPGKDAAERLLIWLDAYQVRGSFDDRTLVIAGRGAPA